MATSVKIFFDEEESPAERVRPGSRSGKWSRKGRLLDMSDSDDDTAAARQRPPPLHSISSQPARKRTRSCADDGDDDVGSFDYDDSVPAAAAAPQNRDHQQRVERRHAAWHSVRDELIFKTTCVQAQRADKHEQQKQELTNSWGQRLAAACHHCPTCAAAGCLQALTPVADGSNTLAFISLAGHIRVEAPWYRCSSCHATGAWPATPTAPSTTTS